MSRLSLVTSAARRDARLSTELVAPAPAGVPVALSRSAALLDRQRRWARRARLRAHRPGRRRDRPRGRRRVPLGAEPRADPVRRRPGRPPPEADGRGRRVDAVGGVARRRRRAPPRDRAASLPLLGVLAALNGAGAAFFAPATSAVLRDVVGDRLIRDATVLGRVSMNIGLIVGTAVGGGIVQAFSPEIALAVGSLLFTCAIAGLRGPPPRCGRAPSAAARSAARARRRGSPSSRGPGGCSPRCCCRSSRSSRSPAACRCSVRSRPTTRSVAGSGASPAPCRRSAWSSERWSPAALRGRLRLAVATLGVLGMALPLGVLALILSVSPYVVDPLHWFFWLSVALFGASVGLELFTIPLDVDDPAAGAAELPRPRLRLPHPRLTRRHAARRTRRGAGRRPVRRSPDAERSRCACGGRRRTGRREPEGPRPRPTYFFVSADSLWAASEPDFSDFTM